MRFEVILNGSSINQVTPKSRSNRIPPWRFCDVSFAFSYLQIEMFVCPCKPVKFHSSKKTPWSPVSAWKHFYGVRSWLEVILRNRKKSFFSKFLSYFWHVLKLFSLRMGHTKNFFFQILTKNYFFAKSLVKKLRMVMFFILRSLQTHRKT